jgi:hypothetical protein
MILAFILTMPGTGSWNGEWSGSGRLYALVRSFRSGAPAPGNYSYAWSDGWRANVEVRPVDAREAAHIRKRSSGFCGYEWMVDSIVKHGEIRDES